MRSGLFDGQRSQMTDSIRLTAETLAAYGERYSDWVFAWSGGKDPTTALTVTVWLIRSGRVKAPRSIRVTARGKSRSSRWPPRSARRQRRPAGRYW
jgi:hypothetical protein